jgi:hypothetical protein
MTGDRFLIQIFQFIYKNEKFIYHARNVCNIQLTYVKT